MRLSEEQRVAIFRQTVISNKWIPITHRLPRLDGKGLGIRQAEFLSLLCREAFYGGAAGGGKSDALLMAALQFVDVPGYNAILFRRTYEDLALPGALMDRSLEWLGGTGARWSPMNHTWTFPSDARLAFGYLKTEQDKFRYQSSEFQFIGFDEVTQFLESQYRYMFSRLRRLENAYVPLRMRGASNPGNIGHDWVKRRLIDEGPQYGRVFIPARLTDNPNLDGAAYVLSLNELDPITRRQYLEGDWTAKFGGSKFKREWFELVDYGLPKDAPRVRYWDMAATTPKTGTDPDYTAGAKLAIHNGTYYLEDMQRFRERPANVEARIKQTAQLDIDLHGNNCLIFMEQEPGSAGVSMIDHYARNVLLGFPFRGHKVTGDKEVRANPVSSAAEQGNFKIVRSSWIREEEGSLKRTPSVWIGDFLDEIEAFPLGSHDDQVDAVSGAFEMLPLGPITAMTGEVQW